MAHRRSKGGRCARQAHRKLLHRFAFVAAFTQPQHVPQAISRLLWEKWETCALSSLRPPVLRLVRCSTPRFRKLAHHSTRFPYATLRRFPLFRTELRVLLVYLYLFFSPTRQSRTARNSAYGMRRAKATLGDFLNGSQVAEFTKSARFSTRTHLKR